MSNIKKRTLFITSTFPRSSVDSTPRFILDLAKSFKQYLNHDVEVVAPHSEGMPNVDHVEGLTVFRFRYFPIARFELISGNGIVPKIKENLLLGFLIPLFILAETFVTIYRLYKFKPHVLVCCWIVPQGLIGALLKVILPKIKIIVVAPGGDAALVKSNALVAFLAKHALRRANSLVSISRFTESQIIEEIGSIATTKAVIPMGINVAKVSASTANLLPSIKDAPKLLFVGRLVKKKGLDYLILAMPALIKKHPKLMLTVVGDGPLFGVWKGLAIERGVSSHINFVGSVPHADLKSYYMSSHLMVVPSVRIAEDFEGLSVVILEAMSLGLPVLATDAGGFADVITNGKTGELIPNSDVSALTNAISRLIQSPEQLKIYATNAEQLVFDAFTYKAIANKYAKLI